MNNHENYSLLTPPFFVHQPFMEATPSHRCTNLSLGPMSMLIAASLDLQLFLLASTLESF